MRAPNKKKYIQQNLIKHNLEKTHKKYKDTNTHQKNQIDQPNQTNQKTLN